MMMPLFCELFQAGNLCAAELVPGPCAAAQGNHAENALGDSINQLNAGPGMARDSERKRGSGARPGTEF
jgi:hypothetical protein